MATFRNLITMATMVMALTAVAPTAVASAQAPAASARHHTLHLAKECSGFTGQPGSYCTFTASNLAAIPVGARATYFGPVLGPARISSRVVIDAGHGTTATGFCNLDLSTFLGRCTFSRGTGALAGFEAELKVTLDFATGWFHWDGPYELDGRD